VVAEASQQVVELAFVGDVDAQFVHRVSLGLSGHGSHQKKTREQGRDEETKQ
jgi:hypothetical protein